VDITLTETATGVQARTSISDANGNFELPDLQPGTYRLSASLPGFKTFVAEDIVLESGQIRRININLEIGEATEEVTVEAGAAVITTESGTISGAVTSQQFKDVPQVDTIPYPGPQSLLSTLPGVQGQGWNVSIAGQQGNQITWEDDGVQNDRSGNQATNMNTYEEVRVVTVNNTADKSRAASFNSTSKRGSNALHGMAYYKHTNSALGARSFFDPEKTPYKFHDFYAELGGPIIRNRTFFYVGWTHIRVPASSFPIATVPTDLMRQGDFSQIPDVINDPLTGEPFPNNIIPQNRMDPTTLRVQELYLPRPNLGEPGQLTNNHGYLFPYPDDYYLADYPLFRVDHQLTESNSLYFRYAYYYSPYVLANPLPGFARTRERYHDKGVISDTHVFSAALVNTFRFGFSGNDVKDGQEVDGFQPPPGNEAVAAIGLQGVNPRGLEGAGFPRMDITGFTSIATTAGGVYNDEYDYSFEDSLTWSTSRHVLKFGVQYNDYNTYSEVLTEGTFGRFGFDGRFSGHPYADFLLGLPYQSQRLDPLLGRWREAGEWGLYVMDTFKVTPNLTIDYGIRWDYFTSPTYDDGLQYNWSPETGLVVPQSALSSVSPLYPDSIAIATGEVVPEPDKNNFRPRIGVAYRLGDTMVIRGGYGAYSERISPFARVQGGGPFEISETYINELVNGEPLFTFPRPFPESLESAVVPSQSVSGFPMETDNGTIHQFNLSLERQVGEVGLRASYVGSRSRGLNYTLNINKPQPSMIPFSQERRPYPEFIGASFVRENGSSNYDSLQLEAQRKMGAITFNANYTWSSNLHNFLNTQNPYDVTSHWSHDNFNQRHRGVISTIIELPWGHGRRYLSTASPVVNTLLGGWRLQTISFFATGKHFSPSFSGSDPSNTNTFGGLPDRIADGNLSRGERTKERWFDPNAFKAPEPGRFGNSGPNVLVGPGLNIHHLSLAKDFALGETFSLTYTAAISNLFNHPHFTNPRSDITAANAGQLVSVPGWDAEKTASRRIQMQLRLEW